MIIQKTITTTYIEINKKLIISSVCLLSYDPN